MELWAGLTSPRAAAEAEVRLPTDAMNAEDLYERHQVLSALGSVLLHDLRNPLHSATLLIEAMGLRTSDLDTMRARLRGQLAKLDALISEVAGPMRDLAVDPQISTIELSDLLSQAGELVRSQADDLDLKIESPPSSLRISCDPRLLGRAIVEIVTCTKQHIAGTGAERPRVTIRVGCTDADTAHVVIEGATSPFPEAVARAPFAISGGGVGVALARALAQISGAALRLQGGSTASPAFVFLLPREGSGSPLVG